MNTVLVQIPLQLLYLKSLWTTRYCKSERIRIGSRT